MTIDDQPQSCFHSVPLNDNVISKRSGVIVGSCPSRKLALHTELTLPHGSSPQISGRYGVRREFLGPEGLQTGVSDLQIR